MPKKAVQEYLETRENYVDSAERKTVGTQLGGMLHVKGEGPQPTWLWKTGGGYLLRKENQEEHRQKSNICVIKEVYAGALYGVLVGENNSPETRLLVSEGGNKPEQWTEPNARLHVMSKLIPDFKSFDQKSIENYQFTAEQLEKIQDDLAKHVIAALIIGDSDGGPGNLGIVFPDSSSLPQFYKIDYGVALNMTHGRHENFLNPLPKLTPELIIQYALFDTETPEPERFVSQRAIEKAIRELASVDPSNLAQVSETFEPVLTHFREKSPNFPNGIARYVGAEPNTIRDAVQRRFSQIQALAATLETTITHASNAANDFSYALPDDGIVTYSDRYAQAMSQSVAQASAKADNDNDDDDVQEIRYQ